MSANRYQRSVCNYCGGSGAFLIIGQNELATLDKESYAYPTEFTIRAIKCLHCGAMNLTLTDNDYFFDDGKIVINDPGAEIIYPEKRYEDLLGLPPAVKEEYEAAKKIKDDKYYAVALGRVLELVCHDKGVTGNFSVSKKIEVLVKKGELPPRIAMLASQLKDLRNIAAHPNLGQLTHEQKPLLDYLCGVILEYLYHIPEMIKQIQLELENIRRQSPQM